jgi:small subunit ribosomal protein S7
MMQEGWKEENKKDQNTELKERKNNYKKMARGKKIKKREIKPDLVYNSENLSKFINYIMRKGKKNIARKIVYGALDIVKEKTKKEPLEAFERAIENISPFLEVRPRRVGGATYQVPVEVRGERKLALAMRWLIMSAKKKKGKPMKERLAEAIMEAVNKTGWAIKKKEDTHRMAEANRAFAHFRW